MKHRVFSVYDGKVGIFMKPFLDPHLGNALRSWEEACTAPESPFHKYPSDFVLYEIGNFDDETGEIFCHDPKQQVATALEMQPKKGPIHVA